MSVAKAPANKKWTNEDSVDILLIQINIIIITTHNPNYKQANCSEQVNPDWE